MDDSPSKEIKLFSVRKSIKVKRSSEKERKKEKKTTKKNNGPNEDIEMLFWNRINLIVFLR